MGPPTEDRMGRKHHTPEQIAAALQDVISKKW
jgi:hypothetical protein